MRIFGSDRVAGIMQRLGMQEGEEIQHPLVSKAIETAQKRVETRNFEVRKHLLDFDDVMNRQRELIYKERDRVLEEKDLKQHVDEMMEDVVEGLLGTYIHPDARDEDKNVKGLIEAASNKFGVSLKDEIEKNGEDLDGIREAILKRVREHYEYREKEFTPERIQYLASYIMLQVIDNKWKDHLYSLDTLKEGIGLRAYGQRDPLIEYKKEAFALFDGMIDSIKEEAVELMFRVQVVREEVIAGALEEPQMKFIHPEAGGMSSVVPQRPAQKSPAGSGGDPSLLHPTAQRGQGAASESVRRSAPKVGRNDPCPCGSGKKYKKCHGAA